MPVTKPAARDVAAAFGQFYDAVTDSKSLRHLGQPELDGAVAAAAVRDVGDAGRPGGAARPPVTFRHWSPSRSPRGLPPPVRRSFSDRGAEEGPELTTLTERVPLDRIEQRAGRAHPGRVLLAVVASVLFSLGWLACKACAVAWSGGGLVRLSSH